MNIRRTTQRLAVSTIAATALLAAAFAPSAFAADDTTVTITGGSLSITNPAAGDFAGRGITGAVQTTTATLAPFSVSDLRGSGAGWHVMAQASQFTAPGAITLAVGSLSMPLPTVASPDTTSADPTFSIGSPWLIDNGAVQIASAAQSAGMGVYNFTPGDFTLSLPADVRAGVYTSTVTLSVVTAP